MIELKASFIVRNKKILEEEYGERCINYKKLAINLKEALKVFLEEIDIDYLDIYFRIKDFESFYDKLLRIKYEKPFTDIEDICGLRIICYYHNDIPKISQKIREEFIVLEETDKADLLDPNKFGYRSHHFIVKIKDEWQNAPNYRGLSDCVAEIQLRTILMHAWAEIEHELAYKRKEHIPDQFVRKLSQLSALFENADDQFDTLRSERQLYSESIVTDDVIKTGKFNENIHLNLDSLQTFLDFTFPNRERDIDDTAGTLDTLIEQGISLKKLQDLYNKVKDILRDIELEEIPYVNEDLEYLWSQIGVINTILDLTLDESWWVSRGLPEPYFSIVEKWRKTIT